MKIIHTAQSFSKNFLQFFYPAYCVSCRVLVCSGQVFCKNCLKKINPLVSYYLPVTAKHTIKVFAVCDYKDPMRNLILKKSFCDILASRQLAKVILQFIDIQRLNVDFIVPVPLHWTRQIRRGFNQSAVMAKIISKQLKIPVLDLLRRTKKTKFQSSLSLELRAQNVKNVFDINKKFKKRTTCHSELVPGSNHYLSILKNKKILLVDDLCTTGATLKNCAKVLIKKQVGQICAVVACRVV